MAQIRATATAPQRFTLVLVSIFALLALVLATIGVYGITAFSIAQRTRELGIRVALGASRIEVLGLVLTHTIRLTLIGVTIGLVAALMLTDLISTLLFGVSSRDPLTLALMALLILLVSIVASLVLAQRATRLSIRLPRFAHEERQR